MTLLKMGVAAACMVVFVVLVRAVAMQRLPKRLFVWMWCVIGLRLVLPFSIPMPFSVLDAFPAIQPAWMYTGSYATAAGAGPMAGTQAVFSDVTSTFPVWLVWLAGGLVVGLSLLVIYHRNKRKFSCSLPVQQPFIRHWLYENRIRRAVQVRVSDQIDTPLTYGFLRPVILLPKRMDWTDETMLATVLTHELVHIKSWDSLKKIVFAAVLAIHWLNPFVWLLYVLLNRDMELACDEKTVKLLGMEKRTYYAMALVCMEEKRSIPMPLYNHFSKYATEERIGAIMKYKKTTILAGIASFALLCCLIVGFGTSVGASALHASASRPATPKEVQSPREVQSYEDSVKDWARYGVSYNALTGRVYYHGQKIRFFVDNRSEDPLQFIGTVYDYEDGALALVTQRDDEGRLVGIREITEKEEDDIAQLWRP